MHWMFSACTDAELSFFLLPDVKNSSSLFVGVNTWSSVYILGRKSILTALLQR